MKPIVINVYVPDGMDEDEAVLLELKRLRALLGHEPKCPKCDSQIMIDLGATYCAKCGTN